MWRGDLLEGKDNNSARLRHLGHLTVSTRPDDATEVNRRSGAALPTAADHMIVFASAAAQSDPVYLPREKPSPADAVETSAK